jgi:hypothetical protein
VFSGRACALGKNTKVDFPSNVSRSKGILDLIHLDVCGPMSVASMQEVSYYVLNFNEDLYLGQVVPMGF